MPQSQPGPFCCWLLCAVTQDWRALSQHALLLWQQLLHLPQSAGKPAKLTLSEGTVQQRHMLGTDTNATINAHAEQGAD